jgi:hypothetical protein
MRAIVLAAVLAVAFATPGLAQPRFGRPGGFGPRGFAQGPAFGHHFPGAHPGRMQQRFNSANISHDGKLTLAQARNANMNAVARHFDEIDTAHKGYITMDDVRSYRRKVMARRRAAQSGDFIGPSQDGGAAQDDDAGTPPP